MKKRILSVILAATMMVMAVGCGSGGSTAADTTGGDAAPAAEEAAIPDKVQKRLFQLDIPEQCRRYTDIFFRQV